MITRRNRTYVLLGTALGLGLVLMILRARVESQLRLVHEADRETLGCLNIGLGMTREEVERELGRPRREVAVTGEGGEAQTVLSFAPGTPAPDQDFPSIKFERGLVVETYCSPKDSLVATPEERQRMFQVLQEQVVLGQDAVRP